MFHGYVSHNQRVLNGAGIFVHSAIPQLPGKRVNPRVDSSSAPKKTLDDVVTQDEMDSGIHLSVFSTFLIISEHHFAFKYSALYW